jgi:hypothetical protein
MLENLSIVVLTAEAFTLVALVVGALFVLAFET